jgi:uncharacterized protein YbcV (DUF1398 family)
MAAITFERYKQARERSAGQPYPQFVKNLKEIGVKRYEVSVADQLTTVYADEGDPLQVPGSNSQLVCSKTFFEPHLKAALQSTQSGLTDYAQFLSEIAEAGVHRYVADLDNMKVSYYGKEPSEKYEEAIPPH